MNDVDFAGQKLAVVLAKPPPPNKTANTRQVRGMQQGGMGMGRGGYSPYPAQPQSNYPQTRYQPYGPASASGGRPRGRGRPFRGATGAPATANQSYQVSTKQIRSEQSVLRFLYYSRLILNKLLHTLVWQTQQPTHKQLKLMQAIKCRRQLTLLINNINKLTTRTTLRNTTNNSSKPISNKWVTIGSVINVILPFESLIFLRI